MDAKRIDRIFVPVYVALGAVAVISGVPRLGSLLGVGGQYTDTAIHTVLALVSLGLLIPGVWWAARSQPVSATPSRRVDLIRQFRKNRAAVVGFHGVTVMVLITALAPLLTPHDPIKPELPPYLPPGAAFLLGTDDLGRDVLARCLYGARISMTVGIVSVALSATLGTLVGALAGFFGGYLDRGLMWVTDVLLAMPRLILLIVIVGTFRPEGSTRLFLLVTVLGITNWMGVARIVRSQVLSIKELDYIAAARSLGLPQDRILLRHVLPNVAAPIIVYASLALGGTILTEASLSFLGLGVPPPTATWGKMIADGFDKIHDTPWVVFAPGAFIVCAVVSLNLLGDGLRDAFDPKLRGRT